MDPSQSTNHVFLKETIGIWIIFGQTMLILFECILCDHLRVVGSYTGGVWYETMHIDVIQLCQNAHACQLNYANIHALQYLLEFV